MATKHPALRFLCLSLGLVISAGALAQSRPVVPSFNDKFERFNVQRWKLSEGWSNGGSFMCTWRSNNARLQPGGGVLLTLNETLARGTYNCGELQSVQKFRFGVFETRLKAAQGSGLSTAFFLFSHQTDKAPYRDINFGVMGKDATGEFVDLAIVWTEKKVSFYQNRELVRETKAPEAEIPQDPMVLVLNLHNRNESWLGPFDPASVPATTIIERMTYTALGEPCQFPESIACKLNLASQ